MIVPYLDKHPIRSRLRRVLPVFFLLGLIFPLAGQVRLKEFLAVSAAGIKDSDGTPQGWIELWNSSQTSKVTLTGMKLTNGTDTWIFPSAEIMPDEHFVVWASGKDRRITTEPLHTNFTIPAAGGTLSLLNSSGTVLSSFADYPAQTADISWGRDEVDISTIPVLTGFYATPTPGERNNYEGSGVAGRIVFDQASQAFTGSMTVSLSQASPQAGAEIRYTTNRTLPTATSELYSAPLTVSTTQMIRARIFQDGKLPGETATEAFLLLNASPSTQNFTSSMPVMVVSNFLTTAPPDSKADQNAFLWVWNPVVPGVSVVKLTDPPTFTSRARIRRRGSSTLGNAKYNLDLEIRNAYDESERDTALMGLPAHSDFIMHAPYSFDRSLMHNPFIFAVSNSIGRYAPRNRMAEVFLEISGSSLNFTGGSSGDYYGIYNILEKIRRGTDRMDLARLDTYNNGDSGKTGGYIWKVDRADADESFSAGGVPGTGGVGMAYDYPKGLDIKSPQRDPQEKYLTQFLNQFNTALQANNKDPQTGWPAYLDVVPTIDHHLMNTWAMCTDALRLSAFWHKDRGGKMAAGPIWDFDRAFASADDRSVSWMSRVTANPANGTWRSPSSDYGTDWFNKSTDATGVQTPVWWHALFRDPDFYQQYIDRWEELRAGPFSQERVSAVIDTLNAEIIPVAASRDTSRWPSNTKRSYASKITNSSYTGQTAEVQRLKDFLKYRGDFMDSQWVGPVAASVPGGKITPGTPVSLTGPAGAVIYYTLDGSDPRPPGGGDPVNPAVLTYSSSTPIVIQATTRLKARARDLAHTALTGLNKPSAGLNNPPLLSTWGGLADLRYSADSPPAPGSLVITEINFHPSGPTSAELAVNSAWVDNDFEFLELRNLSSASIDLSGVQFTSGISYVISAANAVALAPGQYLVIASNPAAFAARYGAAIPALGPWSGNLSNGGEMLTLASATGETLLTLTYDDAWSMEADGGGSTLVVVDPVSPVYGTAANWTPSAHPGGSPGAGDRWIVFAGTDTGAPVSGMVLTGQMDGAPVPPVSYTWTKISGPGTAIFTPPDALTTSVTFSETGVYTLKLSATDGVTPVADEIMIYATETPAGWLARQPGIGILSDDPDGDGRVNLLEYALNANPAVADSGASPVFGLENGFLTITYTRLRPQSAVTYTLEISQDLVTFRPAAAGEYTETILSAEGVTQLVKFTDTVPFTGQSKRFLRLRVTAAP